MNNNKLPVVKSKLPKPNMLSSSSVSSAVREPLEILPTGSSVTERRDIRPALSRRSKTVANFKANINKKPLESLTTTSIAPKPAYNLRRSFTSSQINNTKKVKTNLNYNNKNEVSGKTKKTAATTTKTTAATTTKTTVKSTIKNKQIENKVNEKRTGTKRKSTAIVSDIKPKIAKAAKIPSYDYKARYKALLEKHTDLQSTYKQYKEKIADFETVHDNFIQFKSKCESLESTLENEVSKCNMLTTENKKLNEQLENFEKNYENLTKAHDILTNEFTKMKVDFEKVVLDNKELKTNYENGLSEIERLTSLIEIYKSDLWKNGETIRAMHNTIQDSKGRIRVICRVRPSTDSEKDSSVLNINYVDESTIEVPKAKDGKIEFVFDKVFGPSSSQKEVFEDLAHLVQSALDGYNVCVFAYGQTGSGKTYTMQGEFTENNKGMIPQAVDLIFESIKNMRTTDWSYSIQASFLEIYNESIKDLLDQKTKESLDIQHNDGKSIGIKNLTILDVESAKDLIQLMKNANKNRAVAATNFNEHSSRSHAVTKIHIKGIHKENNTILQGSLNLVDLAGSENAKITERMIETRHINKSLSALGQVILALNNRDSHIPYRNSKLTHLLQNCLGGNSKTLMFVNVSPLEECYQETVNSLRFASNVKEVKINSRKNKTYAKISGNSSTTKHN